jgi:hypothetical protein
MRKEAAQRRQDEQDRIAHIEDHERRLEHDLASCIIALEALEAAENKQTVDQQQADAEAKRLKELVKETEERLDDDAQEGSGDKSYAIVPYKGNNGTFRHPVFIECTADAVTIQPEGIRLTVEDFDGPFAIRQSVAAAVRAAHEELNGRDRCRGANRHAGRVSAAHRAPTAPRRTRQRSTRSAHGTRLRLRVRRSGLEAQIPEPDPRLAQVMAHAVDEARGAAGASGARGARRYGRDCRVAGVGARRCS